MYYVPSWISTTKSTTSLFLNNGGGTVHWSAVQKGREMLAQTEEVSVCVFFGVLQRLCCIIISRSFPWTLWLRFIHTQCAQSKLLSVCLYLKMLVKKSQFRVARLSEEINMENLGNTTVYFC